MFGMRRDDSAKFSFFLGLPVIIGAGFLEGIRSFDALRGSGIGVGLICGVITSFITGLIAIKFLLSFLRNHSLHVFVWYRVVLAIFIFIFI